MSADREGPVPPYRQIATILRARIGDGSIPPGRRIPSLVALEEEFGVARDTLRRAVQVLQGRRLGAYRHGHGRLRPRRVRQVAHCPQTRTTPGGMPGVVRVCAGQTCYGRLRAITIRWTWFVPS
ncbi:GntR family transcriptional regulator [Streptomyces sp. H27-S2]|uniref:GntR family transcriptional regulator n=1 Tax=Streptomyces antarcticus TaxID=2996458 RepID=UPI00226DF062|nr:GntR family transcriptional regulator [Streptomyces sp. H27-S2]MCY0951915.1 GntR family transcriptional regulator [Streptomyces sp. H27-S2]